jgi:hypothetical protein
LELPLGATPVRIFLLSFGVKLTNDTFDEPLPPLVGVLSLTGLGADVEFEDSFRTWVRRGVVFFIPARVLGDVVFVGDSDGVRVRDCFAINCCW